jgi:hypothetical protein
MWISYKGFYKNGIKVLLIMDMMYINMDDFFDNKRDYKSFVNKDLHQNLL